MSSSSSSSSSSSAFKQYLRAKNEVEASMNNARLLRDQWLAAVGENPTNLTKKEIDHIGKAFKNRLLTVKWDCEDLEELIYVCENTKVSKFDKNEALSAKCFVADYRNEITKLMEQLDEIETSSKIYNKHGITLPRIASQLSTTVAPSNMIQSLQMENSSSKYERLLDNNSINNNNNPEPDEVVQFDKSQLEQAAIAASGGGGGGGGSIFTNALYEHLEREDNHNQRGSFSTSHMFNNLSRPVTNVYENPNDNEMILDMLETEYYNPPSGLQVNNTKLNSTLRKILETDRNKFLGAVAFLFSFPIIFLILMAI